MRECILEQVKKRFDADLLEEVEDENTQEYKFLTFIIPGDGKAGGWVKILLNANQLLFDYD